MSVSVKALIFVFSLWISMQGICNWFDGQTDILTASDVAVLSEAGSFATVAGVEPTGESSLVWQISAKVQTALNKILFFDYSFWYVTYAGYTEATCEAADGQWDSVNSLCQFPNSWKVLHYWIFRPFGLAFLIAFVAIAVGIFRGG